MNHTELQKNNIAGRCCHLHSEERFWSELESGYPDHLRWGRSHRRGRHEGAKGAGLQLPGGQLRPGADHGGPQVPGHNIFLQNTFFIFSPKSTQFI